MTSIPCIGLHHRTSGFVVGQACADLFIEGDDVLSVNKAQQQFGANYVELQSIKAKYE